MKNRSKKMISNNLSKKNKSIKKKINIKNDINTLSSKLLSDIIVETAPKKVNKYYRNILINFLRTPFKHDTINLPKNDYYTYINDKWLKDIKMDKELKIFTKIDDFRIVQYKVYKELNNIIKDYIKNNKYTEIRTELNNFYISALNLSSIKNSRIFLKKNIEYIDELRKDKNNLWKMLAFMNKNEFTNRNNSFGWEYAPDKENSSEYCNYIYPHVFAIFDLDTYNYFVDTNDTKGLHNYNNKYEIFFKKYLSSLFTTVVGDSSLNPNDVFDIGRELFAAMSCTSEKESPIFYNKITAKEAMEKYQFNWEEYSKELGFKTTPPYFVTTSLNYLKCCTKLLLDEWNSEKWRSKWIWLIARYVARTNHKWRHIYYEFYGKALKGMEGITSEEHAAITFSFLPFNNLLNNEYINNSYVERNVEYCKNMAEDIRNVFKNIISRNNWLSTKTRDYALFKLNKMSMNIGSQKIKVNDPLLNYNPNDFLGNYQKIMKWRHELYINHYNNNVDNIDNTTNNYILKNLIHIDWTNYPAVITSRPSYLVNAQYVLNENAMYIPLAYIQNPFIDLDERGFEYNLAYMGFTIGHELSHSLDDLGSQYDYKGDLYNWWSSEDKKKYKKIQNEIIKQYEVFASYDNFKYDASLSIGEDIADISGLKICEEYLGDFNIQNKNIPIMISQSYKDFYIYFTYQMKQKIKKKSIKYELIANPHPLDKYRTNVPLSRSEIFRIMHNIKKGDHMYWDNKSGIW